MRLTGGRINRQTRFDADTDSGIGGCRFEQFANKTAAVYEDRNTNVRIVNLLNLMVHLQ